MKDMTSLVFWCCLFHNRLCTGDEQYIVLLASPSWTGDAFGRESYLIQYMSFWRVLSDAVHHPLRRISSPYSKEEEQTTSGSKIKLPLSPRAFPTKEVGVKQQFSYHRDPKVAILTSQKSAQDSVSAEVAAYSTTMPSFMTPGGNPSIIFFSFEISPVTLSKSYLDSICVPESL